MMMYDVMVDDEDDDVKESLIFLILLYNTLLYNKIGLFVFNYTIYLN